MNIFQRALLWGGKHFVGSQNVASLFHKRALFLQGSLTKRLRHVRGLQTAATVCIARLVCSFA